jgi:hypothetical protein
MPGETGLSILGDMRDQRTDRRRAKQEAQQSALDSLASTAFSAAGEPSGLEDVLRIAAAQSAFSSGDAAGGLNSLFLPPSGSAQSGMSRIDPSLPVEEITDISAAVQAGKSPQDIHAAYQQIYGPRTYQRLAPEIDGAIQDALKQSGGIPRPAPSLGL